ncbi:MAG: pyridoxal-phosphate dependent enzyme [Paracoccaceae bacterium]
MTKPAAFRDMITKKTYLLSEPIWRSPDGNPLLITDQSGINRSDIDTGKRSIWRYAKSLPLEIHKPVSLGEGCTPMIAPKIDGARFHLKLEWFAPTGSFKDRGTSVLISYLKQLGITETCEDSSGNAGASVAAYGAAAGMDVTILVPEYTQPAKVTQARAFGANVELVPGTRGDTAMAAIRQADTMFYASHNWHPMFLQGTKSIGYEIWEDLGFTTPDNIVIPASEGSNVLGCYLAFGELIRSGEVDRMPRLFVTQPENCAPLHHRIQGTQQIEFLPTVAEGTAVQSPVRLSFLAEVVALTGGGSLTLSEQEIIAATKGLAKAGILTEPTSAQAWLASKKLVESGQIEKSDTTVVLLTGTGLKSQSVFAN